MPTAEETKAFTDGLHSRSGIPQSMLTTLDAVPKDTHSMTQLSMCVLVNLPVVNSVGDVAGKDDQKFEGFTYAEG